MESKIEISFDISNYVYKDKHAQGIMIECELKQGEEMALWYLSNIIKNMGFKETNESKEKRAKKALNLEE